MAKAANPFTPHQPIDPEYFAGRVDEVQKINAALNQTRHAKTQHVLVTGERGIGKTSLALYARYLARQPNQLFGTDFRFATAYYPVEKNQGLTDICRGLTAKLADQMERGLAEKYFERLQRLGLHFAVQIPGLGEVAVTKPGEAKPEVYLQSDFVRALREFWDQAKAHYNGVLLIIDELHNLQTFGGLGSFFKVVSESWAVEGYRQIMFMVIGLRHITTEISEDDQSAPRIFTYVELNRMTEEESIGILNRCLQDTGKKFEDDAAKIVAARSGGFPYFLHQLGYDAFEVDTDGSIDRKDVSAGLIKSLVQFERMFFGKMYKSVEGKQKQKIVDELAEANNVPQPASELEHKLRIKNVHQYLRSLEEDGLVERVDGRFRLSSDLLAIYIRLFKTIPRAIKEKAQKESQQTGSLSPLQPPPD